MGDEARRTLTIEEVAPILGVSPNTLYRALDRGDCPVPVLRFGKRLVVPKDALEAVLRGESTARTSLDAA